MAFFGIHTAIPNPGMSLRSLFIKKKEGRACKYSFFLRREMINLELKPIKKVVKSSINSKKIDKKGQRHFSFLAEWDLTNYLHKIVDKTSFIKKAIRFYIYFLENPKILLIELRKRNPNLWKEVNRRKFYPGGKFL